jgi:small subunit ribosomal protein S20
VANLASSRKRIKQNERNRTRNKARTSALKTETRKFTDAIHDGALDVAREQFRKLTSKIDQTAAKGTLHRNTAARRKSRLARRLNAAAKAK